MEASEAQDNMDSKMAQRWPQSSSYQTSVDLNGSILLSEAVFLIVGPEEVVITAHRAMLCKIEFFQKCFRGTFKKSEGKQIRLPEDEPNVIIAMLEYMYFGTLPRATQLSKFHEGMNLAKLYAAAVKYCMEDLQNDLADRFRQFALDVGIQPQLIPDLFSILPAGSRLGELLPHLIAYNIRQRGWVLACGDHSWKSLVANQTDMACEITKRLAGALIENPLHVNCRSEWHRHFSSEKCEVCRRDYF